MLGTHKPRHPTAISRQIESVIHPAADALKRCPISTRLAMMSFEIPQSDLNIIEWALNDVFRDQELPASSPYELPEPLLTVWAVERAQGIIDNGGFGYFYENDWPQKPPYSVFWDAFRRIGAVEAAGCIKTTAELFPAARPELDYQMRRDYLNLSRDRANGEPDEIDQLGSRFIDLGGLTFQLLAQYIKDHADHFPTVSQNLTNYCEQDAPSSGAKRNV